MRTPFSNSVRDCVEYILYNFNIARKNDNALILYYWLGCDKLPLLNKYFDGNDPYIEKHQKVCKTTSRLLNLLFFYKAFNSSITKII